LREFFFLFVEGTVPHLEGSWSRYQTKLLPPREESALYSYFKLGDLQSLQEAETGLLELLAGEDQPFDGVIAFSAGCALAAQAIVRHADERRKTNNESYQPLFKFAIFCNGLTPTRPFLLDEVDAVERYANDTALRDHIVQQIDLVAGLRQQGSPHEAEVIAEKRRADIDRVKALQTMALADGTAFLTDGKYGITRFDPCCHKISIPTLHIWDPAASKHLGRGLLELCDPRFAKEYRHGQGHEFPRGNEEIQAIVRLVRDVADV
jgi:hypothetical protein